MKKIIMMLAMAVVAMCAMPTEAATPKRTTAKKTTTTAKKKTATKKTTAVKSGTPGVGEFKSGGTWYVKMNSNAKTYSTSAPGYEGEECYGEIEYTTPRHCSGYDIVDIFDIDAPVNYQIASLRSWDWPDSIIECEFYATPTDVKFVSCDKDYGINFKANRVK